MTMTRLGTALIMMALLMGDAAGGSASVPKQPRREAPPTLMAWGKPLSGGPIRALFIGPACTLRDATELARRLDLTVALVPLWRADAPTPEFPPETDAFFARDADAFEARALERLDAAVDVIVAGNCDLSALPNVVQQRIIERVAAGTGLVLAHQRTENPGPLPELLDGLTWADAPAAATDGALDVIAPPDEPTRSAVRVAWHGEGRIAHIAYPGDPPQTHMLLRMPFNPIYADTAYLENGYSLAAKVVRWAARRDPAFRIAAIEDIAPKGPEAEEIPPGFPDEYVQQMRDSAMRQPTRPFMAHFTEPLGERCTLSVRLRRPGSDTQLAYESVETVPKGAVSHALDLLIGAGDYLVDVWLTGRRGVIDWRTDRVQVSGWPELQSVSYSKNYLLPNDILDLQVEVRSIFSASRTCTVYARAVDPLPRSGARGRLVAEAMQELSGGGEAMLHLNFADMLAPVIQVEVFAVEGAPRRFAEWELAGADRERRLFTVRLPLRERDFRMAALITAPEEYNARAYMDVLREHGLDMIVAPCSEAAMVHAAAAGLRFIPEIADFALPAPPAGKTRQPCFNDPAYRAACMSLLREEALTYWAGGSGIYSLGAGNSLGLGAANVCQCDHCLADFHAAMRQIYKQPAALGAAWGTTILSWEDARPLDPAAARATGRLAPYLDFCTHMDGVFTRFHAGAREQVRVVDRQGLVGFRALEDGNPYHGYVWSDLLTALDFIAVAPLPGMQASPTIEKIRSYQRPGHANALVFGDVFPLRNETLARWAPWHAALRGFSSLWLAQPFGSADGIVPHGVLSPDGQPEAQLIALAEVARPLMAGIGALLLRAKRPEADIAVLDSRPSRHLNDVDPRFGTGVLEAEAAFAAWFDTLGFPYDFIDRSRLIAGGLSAHRLLVLPMSRAMDEAEAVAVRQFVQEGGAVIADIPPAGYDVHGIPWSNPPLDALFGIARDGAPRPMTLRRAALDDKELDLFPGALPRVYTDARIRENGATSRGEGFGDAPSRLWLYREHAKGFTCLFNHTIAPPNPGATKEEDGWRNALGELLQQAGCRTALEPYVTTLFPGHAARFQFGEAEILALLADPGLEDRAIKWRLPFPKRSRVYDMIQGTLLRRPARNTVRLRSGGIALFAVLPYAVKGISIVAPERVAAGRRLNVAFSIRTDGALPGRHLVRLELLDADGAALPHYSRNIVCETGDGAMYMPLAINEVPGRYQLRARDVITGVENSILVQVDGVM
ncbi:MAG TPA: hypothetical protein ENN65_01440 [Candidatus Hydrogenedentes bacterium]|nr:hypothetical protein [Candidatus Hydrogenedentota bacterium]